jgi:hypothetical protein
VENHRFDRIAKAVGRRTTRRLAVGAGALVIGIPGLRRDVPLAEAVGTDFCRTLEPDRIISKHSCVSTNCGSTAESECVCVQTPGHHVRCAARFEVPNDCPRKDQCSERRPCGRGKFCAKVFACCNNRTRRICLRPCPA